MDPEQALLFLKQVLVVKPGLTLDDIAAIVQAWNVVAEAIEPKDAPKAE